MQHREEVKTKANNLRRQGVSYGKISKLLGISKSTAHEYCKYTEKVSAFSNNTEEIVSSKKRSDGASNEVITLYAVAKNELEYVKKENKQLEEEVYCLRTENHKLSNENSDLTINVRTAETEKRIAVAQALLDYKANNNSGLGALTDPNLINVLGDLAAKVIPMFKKPDPNVYSIPNELKELSEAKREIIYFVAAKITTLSEAESNKLAWLVNCIIDNKKIEEFFEKWQRK